LSLPIGAHLTPEQQQRVVERLKSWRG